MHKHVLNSLDDLTRRMRILTQRAEAWLERTEYRMTKADEVEGEWIRQEGEALDKLAEQERDYARFVLDEMRNGGASRQA
jgi:hypothetical protein